ncbi:hypothetical protein Hanom_Chr06g00542841 [Helianthus anomalus]
MAYHYIELKFMLSSTQRDSPGKFQQGSSVCYLILNRANRSIHHRPTLQMP